MAQSAAEVGRRLVSVATAIERGEAKTLLDMALAVKDEMNDGVQSAGIPRGSKINGRKAPFAGAGFKMEGSGVDKVARMAYRPPAFAYWREYGTGGRNRGPSWTKSRKKPYAIVSKSYGKSRRKRAELVDGPGMFAGRSKARRAGGRMGAVRTPQGIRSNAMHPGARPKPFWQATRLRSQKVAVKTATHTVKRNIASSAWGRN